MPHFLRWFEIEAADRTPCAENALLELQNDHFSGKRSSVIVDRGGLADHYRSATVIRGSPSRGLNRC
jgi:hypothetical protein